VNAVLQAPEVRLESMTLEHLDAVCAVETTAYDHPWSRANFADSLAVGYHCQLLVGPADEAAGGAETLIGYFVAMTGVEEVHLLNITVAPAFQRQGWASLMLDILAGWSRAQGAQWLWLEVRTGNARALQVYERQGYRRVGVRKGYYPAHGGREDAIVMSLRLDAPASAWAGLPS
jgi:ribosomal-protein-alanine N-acetyltransferase